MREKGREKMRPKAHSKKSDFGTPYDLGSLYYPFKRQSSHSVIALVSCHDRLTLPLYIVCDQDIVMNRLVELTRPGGVLIVVGKDVMEIAQCPKSAQAERQQL